MVVNKNKHFFPPIFSRIFKGCWLHFRVKFQFISIFSSAILCLLFILMTPSICFNFFFVFVLQMNGFDDLHSGVNNPPLPPQPPGVPAAPPKQDYKLLADPFLVKAPQKIYRYNGIIPNEASAPPVILKDPRNMKAIRIRVRLDPMELIVPRYNSSYCSPNYYTAISNYPKHGKKSSNR